MLHRLAPPHGLAKTVSIKTLIISIVAVMMAGVYALDFAAGREFNLWLLYLLPIALGTFSLGSGAGYALCALATLLLLLNGQLLGNPFPSTGAFLFDRFSSAMTYALVTFLIGLGRPDNF